jgi:phage-related protein
MPLQTFAPGRNPNIDFQVNHEPKIISAQMGDGYSQRTPAGINFQPRSWNLRWEPITVAEADAIEAFLIARGGYEAFWWTPPRGGPAVKVICPRWVRTEPQWNASGLMASFVENFDLVS